MGRQESMVDDALDYYDYYYYFFSHLPFNVRIARSGVVLYVPLRLFHDWLSPAFLLAGNLFCVKRQEMLENKKKIIFQQQNIKKEKGWLVFYFLLLLVLLFPLLFAWIAFPLIFKGLFIHIFMKWKQILGFFPSFFFFYQNFNIPIWY